MIPDIDENNEINENDFFADFETDKKEYKQPELNILEDEPETLENSMLTANIQKTNQLASKTLVNTSDSLFALLLSLYAMSDNVDLFQLSDEEKADLSELISAAMPDNTKAMPIWLQLSLVLSITYGNKIKIAHSQRQENEKLKKLDSAKYEAELKELQANEETSNKKP